MGKRFVITESEKNSIRQMYGLVIEASQNLPSLPYPVRGGWTAPDCDALHAFQSRKEQGVNEKGEKGEISVVYGDMNAKVCEALALYWKKIPVKVTNVKVTINGMNVSYEVTIDKSPNNIGMNGFTSKGAGCESSLSSSEETIKYLKKRATTERGKSPSEIQSNIKLLPGVGNLNYFEEVSSFYDPNLPDGKKIYQVFYQYQTDNPPSVKSQETMNNEKNKINNQTTGVISVMSSTLKDFTDNIASKTSNVNLDLNSIKLDVDKKTFSVNIGNTPVYKIVLRYNMSGQLDCESCDSTISRNTDYGAKELKGGTFENDERIYSLIVLFPKK